MVQREILEPGPLLDGRGRLREAGWARRPLFAYDRASVAAPLRRIKEWDRYFVLADEYGVSVAAADLGYVGVVSATVMDFAARTSATENLLVPLPLGALAMPSSPEAGDVKIRHRGGAVDFAVMPGGARIVKVDLPGFDKGKGLRGAVVLTPVPGGDLLAAASSWRRAPSSFFYKAKDPCLSAEGMMASGGRELSFRQGSARGFLSWGRGVRPFRDSWLWAAGSGSAGGEPFAFNFGYDSGDDACGTENALFFRGRLHKLGSVTFRVNPRDPAQDWRFTSDDGRLEMTMECGLERTAGLRFFFYASTARQVFGRFSGRAVLDDGTVLEFRGAQGFAERTRSRW